MARRKQKVRGAFCPTGKRSYLTEEEANEKIKAINIKKKLYVYFCIDCQHFHLTKRKQSTKMINNTSRSIEVLKENVLTKNEEFKIRGAHRRVSKIKKMKN